MFQAKQEEEVIINAPGGGEALQGIVSIRGSTRAAGFRSAEVAFAFEKDLTGTWFLIQQSSTPVEADLLATWDTTTITDGVYKLRVQVLLEDGQVIEKVVNGLRVRNYSPVETSTPTEPPGPQTLVSGEAATGQATVSVEEKDTPVPARTPATAAVMPGANLSAVQTRSPLPANPAQLTARDLWESAFTGVAVVVGLLVLAGMYLGMRSLFKR